MTNKSTGMAKAFLNLSDAEKKEVKQFIEEYDGLGYFEKAQRSNDLNESFKRIMGPVSQDRCPLCGK